MIKTDEIIENPINQKKAPMAISNFSTHAIGFQRHYRDLECASGGDVVR
jgi:hypothetical protein